MKTVKFTGLAKQAHDKLSSSFHPDTIRDVCLQIAALEWERDWYKEELAQYQEPVPFTDPKSLMYLDEPGTAV